MPAPHIIAYFYGGGSCTARRLAESGSAQRLTLINYAFGIPQPDPATGQVVCALDDPSAAYAKVYNPAESLDGEADAPGQPLRGHFNQLRNLKQRYPHLKLVASLGGWTGSTWFSYAARTPDSRKRFVASCIDLFIRGNLPLVEGAGGPSAGAGVFDGIDVDWEYPVTGGLETTHTHPDDAANFVLLLDEFRRQYAAMGRHDLLLTAAVPGPPEPAAHYSMPEAQERLDLVHLMTYDFTGIWSDRTGHHTNLCSPPGTPDALSVDRTVRLFRETHRVPAEKLVIGAAFYGKSWTGVPPENDGLGQPGQSGAGAGYHTLAGLVGQGYTRHWDAAARAPWLYSTSVQTFWTYDDPQSLALKARYARRHGLAGVMFWEISGDDEQGTLVETIHRALNEEGKAEDPDICPGRR